MVFLRLISLRKQDLYVCPVPTQAALFSERVVVVAPRTSDNQAPAKLGVRSILDKGTKIYPSASQAASQWTCAVHALQSGTPAQLNLGGFTEPGPWRHGGLGKVRRRLNLR